MFNSLDISISKNQSIYTDSVLWLLIYNHFITVFQQNGSLVLGLGTLLGSLTRCIGLVLLLASLVQQRIFYSRERLDVRRVVVNAHSRQCIRQFILKSHGQSKSNVPAINNRIFPG